MRFLHSHIADQRGDDGLIDALTPGVLHHINEEVRKDRGWRNNRMPIAENEGMHTWFLQGKIDGFPIRLRRLPSSDVDRVSGRAKGWNELSEGLIQIGWHGHQP
jgi:hypothetical protein